MDPKRPPGLTYFPLASPVSFAHFQNCRSKANSDWPRVVLGNCNKVKRTSILAVNLAPGGSPDTACRIVPHRATRHDLAGTRLQCRDAG